MKKQLLLVLVFTLLLAIVAILPGNAVEADKSTSGEPLETVPLSQEQKEYYLDHMEITEVLTGGNLADYTGDLIQTFDVSDTGMIAIGLKRYTILICDNDMNIQKVIKFDPKRSDADYYLNWDEDILELIEDSSRAAYGLDSEGNIVEVSQKAYSKAMTKIALRDSKTVGGITYKMQRSGLPVYFLGSGGYNTFTRTEGTEETELFRSTNILYIPKSFFMTTVIPICIESFVSVVVISIIVVVVVKKRRKK